MGRKVVHRAPRAISGTLPQLRGFFPFGLGSARPNMAPVHQFVSINEKEMVEKLPLDVATFISNGTPEEAKREINPIQVNRKWHNNQRSPELDICNCYFH